MPKYSKPVPFRLPKWRKAVIKRKEHAQALVIHHALDDVRKAFESTIDQMVYLASQGAPFTPPDLSGVDWAMSNYLRRCLMAGFAAAREESHAEGSRGGPGHKRLSALPKGQIPSLRSLAALFKNPKAWGKIMDRNEMLSGRLKRAYLEKLKTRFQKVTPKLMSGEMTPDEAKMDLVDSVRVTRSRAENIFQTETTKYFSETQVAFFDGDDDILGFLFDSISDSGRTEICRSRHGLIYLPGTALLKKNTPALHWQCRSHLIALANTPGNRKMIADPSRDPSKKSVAPLPPGWKN